MLDEFIKSALAEDIQDGDHSSMACVPKDASSKAVLLIKEKGVLAGMQVAKRIVEIYDPNLVFTAQLQDGDHVEYGQIAFTLEGAARSILATERLILNCMQHMSGIATQTAYYVSLISGTNCTLLDTRKTTPGLRFLDKYAVKIGGGANHRFGLYDMIMLKDNHIDYAGGLSAALARTKSYLASANLDLKVEVEVRSMAELQELLSLEQNYQRIMLDNFSPEELKAALALIPAGIETEASGGITSETIRSYAETGVQFISVGALTHSVKALDMSLKAQL
ncbi:MAG: carboxylating nicotinate-nucleotide diphosphorylase [Flavobacteriia bacterium]|jgi:nicotinate-nucleotide pyrophosphorylase (carboxylating)